MHNYFEKLENIIELHVLKIYRVLKELGNAELNFKALKTYKISK